MDFVTDLNHRERAAIVADMRAVLPAMMKLAKALEEADDQTLLIEYVISVLGWQAVRSKLDPVMKEAAEVAKVKAQLDGFKGF